MGDVNGATALGNVAATSPNSRVAVKTKGLGKRANVKTEDIKRAKTADNAAEEKKNMVNVKTEDTKRDKTADNGTGEKKNMVNVKCEDGVVVKCEDGVVVKCEDGVVEQNVQIEGNEVVRVKTEADLDVDMQGSDSTKIANGQSGGLYGNLPRCKKRKPDSESESAV
jgi:hypothetical protein